MLEIERTLQETKRVCKLLIPYSAQAKLSQIHNLYKVNSVEYGNDGTIVEAVLDKKGQGMLAEYIVEK